MPFNSLFTNQPDHENKKKSEKGRNFGNRRWEPKGNAGKRYRSDRNLKHSTKMIFLSLAIFQTVICDHMRAPEYYIASVQNNCSWKAFPCHSLSDCEAGKNTTCDGKCPSMGYDADKTDLTGNYYLKTNSNPPFCGMLVFILLFHMVLQHHWLGSDYVFNFQSKSYCNHI